ncbi:MAG: hypothetical protein QOI14_1253 [Actinomycetota bacterium]|nr:hypothetical protein [Actinomycetota bacterium]
MTARTATATSIEPRGRVGRLAYATLGVLLLTAIVFGAAEHGTGYWQIAAFALGPDLALFYGAASGLEKGQLHPRAVGVYNLVHRFWGPLVLATLASFDLIAFGFFIGALAWAFHVALDRALGYGLRTRDGFQRR